MARLRERRCDALLLDINMEDRSGLDALGGVHAQFPGLPIPMRSMYPEDQYAIVVLKAGANGYVSKDIEADELVRAVRDIARGGIYLTPPIPS